MAAFGYFCLKIYLGQISILGTNKWEIWKNQGTKEITFKIDITKERALTFSDFLPKIGFWSKYLLDKNSPKQPLWSVQKQTSIRFTWVFIVLGIYNFA